jgi:hypothetical protein
MAPNHHPFNPLKIEARLTVTKLATMLELRLSNFDWFDKLTILSLCFNFAQYPEFLEGSKDRARQKPPPNLS